ncbi:hypothetical protein CLOM_g456 [Closterium sp. NIES-68]|nr:hypothetical protein CLOM_g456 [Closterium sp. NIES-68]GJP65351.1 hypothetical protein CLOP_g22245 [Closterium sp. NIES-67]
MRFETAAAAQSFSAAIQGLMNEEKEGKLHSCVSQPSQPRIADDEAPSLSTQLQILSSKWRVSGTSFKNTWRLSWQLKAFLREHHSSNKKHQSSTGFTGFAGS